MRETTLHLQSAVIVSFTFNFCLNLSLNRHQYPEATANDFGTSKSDVKRSISARLTAFHGVFRQCLYLATGLKAHQSSVTLLQMQKLRNDLADRA
jgi:hypothetical protein